MIFWVETPRDVCEEFSLSMEWMDATKLHHLFCALHR